MDPENVEVIPDTEADTPEAETEDVSPATAAVKKPPVKKPRKKIPITTQEPEIICVDDNVLDTISVDPILPLARVKNLMKLNPDVKNISADAAYLVTKATEIFIRKITEKSWSHTEQAHRKILSEPDFRRVLDSEENLRFLEDMV